MDIADSVQPMKDAAHFAALLRVDPAGGVWSIDIRDTERQEKPFESKRHFVCVTLSTYGRAGRLGRVIDWLKQNGRVLAEQADRIDGLRDR